MKLKAILDVWLLAEEFPLPIARWGFRVESRVQESAERWTPGCVNGAGKFRQMWQARAATKFTKPGDQAEPCMKYGANLPFA